MAARFLRGRLRSGPLAAAVATVLSVIGAPAAALDEAQALATSQAAIGRETGNHRFTDQDGRPLELATLRGRPVVLSYIYTSCAFICPTLTSSLAQVVRVARETLGDGAFSVVTVGFDTRVDTPERMRLHAAERGIRDPRWYFLSGDEAEVAALARETGFVYAPVAGGFDHLTQVTILDSAGRVYQQVYGPEFQPPMLVDPLKRLALGMPVAERPLADLLSRVRLLCTSYDPKSGRYRFDYSLILEIAIGLSCALLVLGFVLRSWRQGQPGPRPRS
ncbi:MAG: SCO family protein [Gammaproteobacteria bacterium]|nr:MAG: SCO family protein [Gammaproteobacteria bacterium]